MTPARNHPHLFAVNARLWLSRLSAGEGRIHSLSTIPRRHLEALAERFDLLWLMGSPSPIHPGHGMDEAT